MRIYHQMNGTANSANCIRFVVTALGTLCRNVFHKYRISLREGLPQVALYYNVFIRVNKVQRRGNINVPGSTLFPVKQSHCSSLARLLQSRSSLTHRCNHSTMKEIDQPVSYIYWVTHLPFQLSN